jgi:uncharacterized protein with GYD domain
MKRACPQQGMPLEIFLSVALVSCRRWTVPDPVCRIVSYQPKAEERGNGMPKYIMLSSLTDEGASTVKKNPERIKEVNKDVEALGGKVIDQYAVIGEYDFINIVEAPDIETIARISVELGSRGSVHIKTLAAIPIDEFIARLK